MKDPEQAEKYMIILVELQFKINTEYSYEEIPCSEVGSLLSLHNSLAMHMIESPTYFPNEELSKESFIAKCTKGKSRFFIVKDKSEIIGYFQITDRGETFITEEPDYLHICGAL